MKTTIWPYIILSYASLFVYGFTENIRGPLFPDILSGFKVTDAVGSWMFAITSVSGFTASYSARFLLRRFERINVLRMAAFLSFVSIVGLCVSPNFGVFLFFSFLVGLSQGILALIPNILVPLGASQVLKQQLLSGLHSMYGLASFMAPLGIAALSALTHDWRWGLALASPLPLALFFYTLHKSHVPAPKKVPEEDLDRPMISTRHAAPQLFLASVVSFNVAAEVMLSSRLALFMRREHHSTPQEASLYVTYFFVGMLAGRLLFTVHKFSAPLLRQLSISLILTLLCLLAGLFYHPLFLPLCGLFIAPFYPLAISFISSEFTDDLDSAVSYMTATDCFMLIVMHLFIGKMTSLFDIKYALLAGAGFLVISFILTNTYTVFFPRRK